MRLPASPPWRVCVCAVFVCGHRLSHCRDSQHAVLRDMQIAERSRATCPCSCGRTTAMKVGRTVLNQAMVCSKLPLGLICQSGNHARSLFFFLPTPRHHPPSHHSKLSRRKLTFKPLLCRNHRPGLGPSPERGEIKIQLEFPTYRIIIIILRPVEEPDRLGSVARHGYFACS